VRGSRRHCTRILPVNGPWAGCAAQLVEMTGAVSLDRVISTRFGRTSTGLQNCHIA
jgi:hypothetical protein